MLCSSCNEVCKTLRTFNIQPQCSVFKYFNGRCKVDITHFLIDGVSVLHETCLDIFDICILTKKEI